MTKTNDKPVTSPVFGELFTVKLEEF